MLGCTLDDLCKNERELKKSPTVITQETNGPYISFWVHFELICCVCAFLYMLLHICAGAPGLMYICVCLPEDNLVYNVSRASYPVFFFLRQGFSLTSSSVLRLVWLSRCPRNLPMSVSPVLGLQEQTMMTDCFIWALGSNLRSSCLYCKHFIEWTLFLDLRIRYMNLGAPTFAHTFLQLFCVSDELFLLLIYSGILYIFWCGCCSS